MSDEQNSANSITDATRSRSKFSGHGGSLGAAGYKTLQLHSEECEFLSNSGNTLTASPPKEGFGEIILGAAWDNVGKAEKKGFLSKLLGKAKASGIDLDLGCLYEMQDGSVGAIQAFGKMFGNYDQPPYMKLTGDETTGDADGLDETIIINGAKWSEIKRVLVYIYIYNGAINWSQVKPQVQILIPNQKPMIVTPHTHHSELEICAIAEIESLRGGMRLKNHSEYFPGHAEMDRAFGYGLEWDDGEK